MKTALVLSQQSRRVESWDGRAVGWRTGVLFNLAEERTALLNRGLPDERLDGAGVCAESIAMEGPRALSRLARHGLVAVAHRAAGTLMVASDAQGIAPLYVLDLADGGRLIAGDRQALRDASGLPLARHDEQMQTLMGPATGTQALWRCPPGLMLMLHGTQLKPTPWVATGDASPFYRDRPAALLTGDRVQLDRAVDHAIGRSVTAWQTDRGPLAAGAVPKSPEVTAWPEAALASLCGDLPDTSEFAVPRGLTASDLQAAHASAHDGSPFPVQMPPEPVARLSEERQTQRWLRHTWWRLGPIEAALDGAAERGQAVALPHLAPHVIATLGATGDAYFFGRG
ncbi:MAG: hypothetical protein KC502_04665 [Myxococcales bacterium]|nr:hypothetical protein [Myxococcales bacterium]